MKLQFALASCSILARLFSKSNNWCSSFYEKKPSMFSSWIKLIEDWSKICEFYIFWFLNRGNCGKVLGNEIGLGLGLLGSTGEELKLLSIPSLVSLDCLYLQLLLLMQKVSSATIASTLCMKSLVFSFKGTTLVEHKSSTILKV